MQQCVCHYYFSFKQCKHNIATVRVRFYHIRNNRGLGCCEPWPLAQVISLTANLITPDITKTSSSNCLILSAAILGVDPWEPQVFSQWHSQQMPHPPHKNNISPLKSYHFPSSLGQSWFRWEPRSQRAVFQGTPKLQLNFLPVSLMTLEFLTLSATHFNT